MPDTSNFLFVQLSADALTAGKYFDALAAGSFVDMSGRAVTFKADEFPVYLANTLAAIEATRSEGGEVVGLPIDCRDHENGDGAGWIVGATLEDGKIRALPKWTEVGVNLISKSIRRFFSATVDVARKVIVGGTLTNWPATRNAQGHILLRPIEMAQATGVFKLATDDAEDSLNDQVEDVSQAFREQFGMVDWDTPTASDGGPCCVLVEIFADHVIAHEAGDDDLYSVAYTRSGPANDTITFAPRAEWKPVKQLYSETALQRVVRQARRIAGYLGLPLSDLAMGGKTEGGEVYPERCYLSVPDAGKPSGWGLRICEMVDGKPTVTRAQLGRAAAALGSGGFRGQKYQAKTGESLDGLKKKLVAQYKKLGVDDKDIPVHLALAGDIDMPFKLEDLDQADQEKLAAMVAAKMAAGAGAVPPPAAPATAPADLAALMAGVTPLTEDGKRMLTEFMARQAAQVQEQARLAYMAQMAAIQRENAVTELCQRVTGGSEDAPRGLKGVAADELKAHLLALPADEALYFGKLLDGVVKDGLVSFAELGHARKLSGTHALPAEFAEKLDKKEIALADLAHPILGLGDLAQYDLTRWQGAAK